MPSSTSQNKQIDVKTITKAQFASMLDHTNLKANATTNDILTLCKDAKKYGFASVCVNPAYVPLAAKALAGSSVKTCTVVGFPLGASATSIKAQEAYHAVLQGADEVDMVINLGLAKDGKWDLVTEDIACVVHSAREAASTCIKTVIVKVIIETCYLSDEEKVCATKACIKAGADFVKTSTGFGTSGATVADVTLMQSTINANCTNGQNLRIKAAGGIRDIKTALALIDAGASRLGVSASLSLLDELGN